MHGFPPPSRLRVTGPHGGFHPEGWLKSAGLITNFWSGDDVGTGALATWTDRISGLAPTQGTAANQPTASVNALAQAGPQKRGLTFDATDFLEIGAVTGLPTGTNPCVVFTVFRLPVSGTSPGNIHFSYGDNATAHGSRQIGSLSSAGRRPYANDSTTSINDKFVYDVGGGSTVKAVITATIFWNGQIITWSNGNQRTSVAAAFSTATNKTVIGGRCAATVDALFGVGGQSGILRHIIVLGMPPIWKVIQAVEGWLAHDCGLQSLYPAAHPYRWRAP